MVELSVLPVADPIAELPATHAPPERASLGVRLTMLTAVLVPFLSIFAAVVFLWGRGFSWVDLGLLLGLYFLTALGITIGFHRLFTHRAFETNSVVKFSLGVLGSMAVQGPLFKWVAVHRRHHRYSDKPDDPHSPHHEGEGVWGVVRGLWHAHIGWLFKPDPPDLDRYIKDLCQSRMLRFVNTLFPLWVLAGLVIPAVIGGLLTLSWTGVWTGLVWGGLLRVFVVHHVTWSINSVCHVWGVRPYRSEDQSRDNVVFGILGMGEGWHHTHHTFPTSARHGLRWWQIDVSYWIIRLLAVMGLAWNVRVPSKQMQAARRN